MTTIVIDDQYADVLSALGDLEEAVEQAFRRYAIEQIAVKISDLSKANRKFETKYGMSYPEFSEKIATDEEFVRTVEGEISLVWESDLIHWEFSYKGAEDWTQKLQAILLT